MLVFRRTRRDSIFRFIDYHDKLLPVSNNLIGYCWGMLLSSAYLKRKSRKNFTIRPKKRSSRAIPTPSLVSALKGSKNLQIFAPFRVFRNDESIRLGEMKQKIIHNIKV